MAFVMFSNIADAQHNVRVTYYNLNGITASGKPVQKGICAVSRELLEDYPMGTLIVVEGYGIYEVADKTATWIKNTIDIWSKEPLPTGHNIKCRKYQPTSPEHYLMLSETNWSIL